MRSTTLLTSLPSFLFCAQPPVLSQHLLYCPTNDRYSPPSLRHSTTQSVLPSVVVLGCGFSVPVCGFVRTFD